MWSDFALEFLNFNVFHFVAGSPTRQFPCGHGPVFPPMSHPIVFRLQTARDATPVHPGAGSGRLQAGVTPTPTPCQPRWALTDSPGARMVTDTTVVTPGPIMAPLMVSTTDTTTAGRGPGTTSSPGLTRDSSTSDEDLPEPKTWDSSWDVYNFNNLLYHLQA